MKRRGNQDKEGLGANGKRGKKKVLKGDDGLKPENKNGSGMAGGC